MAATTLGFSCHAAAHSGELDPTFGHGGIATYNESQSGGCRSSANAVAVHPDGSIIVAGDDYDSSGNEDYFAAKLDGEGGQVAVDSIGYGDSNVEGRAIAIAADSGEIYVGGNLCNTAVVYAYHSDLTLDTAFGSGGEVVIAAFDDFVHSTRLNGLVYNENDGSPLYVTGTYNGAGNIQILLSRFDAAGNSNATSMGIFSGDNIATSVGVYTDESGPHEITAGYAGSECFAAGFLPQYVSGKDEWTFEVDPSYTMDQYTYDGAAGCYTDTLTVLPDNSQLAGGRVMNTDGSWSAYFQKLAAGGGGSSPYDIFKMTPWGDNSIRKILVQPDGKWIMVGFTGVDSSGTAGPWVGRFNASGTVDTSFGNAGATLIDFDSQDYLYGNALSGALDRYGRVVIAGTYWTGTSDANNNDCTLAYVARFTSDDLIFTDGFDDSRPNP